MYNTSINMRLYFLSNLSFIFPDLRYYESYADTKSSLMLTNRYTILPLRWYAENCYVQWKRDAFADFACYACESFRDLQPAINKGVMRFKLYANYVNNIRGVALLL